MILSLTVVSRAALTVVRASTATATLLPHNSKQGSAAVVANPYALVPVASGGNGFTVDYSTGVVGAVIH